MKTIAILDDDPTLVELYTNILQDEGYNVVTLSLSSTIKELIEKLRQSRAKVLILDIKIPGIDALQIIKELEVGPLEQQLKVLICSGAYQDIANLIQKLEEAKLNVPLVLRKPFDLDVFVEHLERLTQND